MVVFNAKRNSAIEGALDVPFPLTPLAQKHLVGSSSKEGRSLKMDVLFELKEALRVACWSVSTVKFMNGWRVVFLSTAIGVNCPDGGSPESKQMSMESTTSTTTGCVELSKRLSGQLPG